MNVLGAALSTSSPSPSSSSAAADTTACTSSSDSNLAEMVGRFICVIITCAFATVGSLIGAMTGGLIGLANESGLFRGAGIGAITGAVFSVEVVESSLALWSSNESGIWSLFYVIDIISSLLNGGLVSEKFGPAVQSAVRNQMSAEDSPFMEALDIFDTGDAKGMPRECVDKLPKIEIAAPDNVDAMGERICCVVCLQGFEIGETVRSLPHCQHMFHLPCIDGWLIRHGSCPLCRRDF